MLLKVKPDITFEIVLTLFQIGQIKIKFPLVKILACRLFPAKPLLQLNPHFRMVSTVVEAS